MDFGSFILKLEQLQNTVMTSARYDHPVNIGSDRLVTINELADMIIKISGKTITKNTIQKHHKALEEETLISPL
jgi:nucleoside-diphosphate-sugar epimerase